MHIQEELITSGYMRAVSTDGSMAAKAKAKTRKTLKQQRLSAFRQFTSPGGFQILVGRNNRQNDELTHSIAKAADTWLHARGVPGENQGFRWYLQMS
jgi:predicted ribosome quality control (RQC) complex YloA/Tae2 family protein